MGSRKNIPIVKALLAAMFARQLTFFFSFGLGGLFNGQATGEIIGRGLKRLGLRSFGSRDRS